MMHLLQRLMLRSSGDLMSLVPLLLLDVNIADNIRLLLLLLRSYSIFACK